MPFYILIQITLWTHFNEVKWTCSLFLAFQGRGESTSVDRLTLSFVTGSLGWMCFQLLSERDPESAGLKGRTWGNAARDTRGTLVYIKIDF